MDALPPTTAPEARDLKAFWSKPEGKATLLLAAGAGCVLFYYWGLILPFLITTLQNTLYFGILCGVVALVIFLITNRQLRTMMFYLWRTFMRRLAGLIVEIDPIAILKIYIRDLEDKAAALWQKISELAGAEEKLGAKLRKNDEEAQSLLQMAAKAREMGKTDAAQLSAMKAAGLKTMNEKLMPLFHNMQRLHAFLDKAYKAADFVVKQSKIQVELKEAEYDAIKTSSKALQSAMSVFKGDPDKRAMFEQSIDYINDDMAKKVGEMKRIMEMSTEFIDNADIESGVNYDKGMAMLDEFEHRLTILSPATVTLALPAKAGQTAEAVLAVSAPVKKSGSEWE